MNTLFPIEPAFPEGFGYYPDFLKMQDEEQLYKEITGIELHDFNFQGFTAKRKVASFGYDYSFDKRTLSKGKEIPKIFDSLIDKVANYLNIPSEDFAELLVTQYPVGSVINWHRDAPPFDIIAGISILSDCLFRLRPHDKAKQSRSSVISFPVKRRSLYVMQGPARSEWQHSISPVKDIRYSITLRTLKKQNIV
jgi:alkylated DNA repair dioxygenase AlkB